MNTDRFKYRAWDTQEEEMDLDFIVYPYWTEKDHLEGLIIMQCTGLKDSNNTLIYEGDIVEWRRHDGETNNLEDMVSEVYWEEEGLLWGLRTERFDELGCYVGYKVIGNIYENPEILEKQDNEG